MKTKEQIAAHIHAYYDIQSKDTPDWAEYWINLCTDLINELPGSEMTHIYLDIGQMDREYPDDMDHNTNIIIIKNQKPHYRETINQFLRDCQNDGIDAWSIIYSMDQYRITIDAAY